MKQRSFRREGEVLRQKSAYSVWECEKEVVHSQKRL